MRPLFLLCLMSAVAVHAPVSAAKGSAIFIHPDGMGANTWSAVRLLQVGPDGRLNWDKLPQVAVYVGPLSDNITQSSNGGATAHAYGLRAQDDSYGTLNDLPIEKSLSGFSGSLMREAQAAGKAVGIVNSSTIAEPGTGAFLAQVKNRKNEGEIISQILVAKPDVIMGGGEQFYLPVGTKGRHGPGARKDGRNLVKEAKAAGYTIIYTADELTKLPENKTRVLGIFASDQTFNEGTEAALTQAKLKAFQPQAPRYDAMMGAALRILKKSPQGYLLVGNEEGTDNLSGENNATATLDAAAGADRAIGIAMAEAEKNPELTVIVASDSDNGGMNASGDDDLFTGETLVAVTENGSPVDGENGKPFIAAADARGKRLPFVVTWASTSDSSGGTVARGIGPGAKIVHGTIDSTDIYRALYLGLFGKKPD